MTERGEASRQNISNFIFGAKVRFAQPILLRLKRTTNWSFYPQGLPRPKQRLVFKKRPRWFSRVDLEIIVWNWGCFIVVSRWPQEPATGSRAKQEAFLASYRTSIWSHFLIAISVVTKCSSVAAWSSEKATSRTRCTFCATAMSASASARTRTSYLARRIRSRYDQVKKTKNDAFWKTNKQFRCFLRVDF